MHRRSILLLVILFASLPLSAQLTVTYQVRDLGVLPAWNASSAEGINWLSQVTGTLSGPVGASTSVCHAFLWNALTGMRDIGTVGEFCASGAKIDLIGRVAGGLTSAAGPNPAQQRTFFYGLGGPITDIGSVYGHATDLTVLQEMNNRAEIVGYSHEQAVSNSHAFYWSRTTGIVDLQPLAPDGALTSIAHGISDSGRITGHTVGYGPPRAFYMQSRTTPMIDLPTRFPAIPAGSVSFGLYINNRNQIAGEYKVGTSNIVFLIPDPEGAAIYFTGDLGPYGTTVTRGLSEAGQVIGIWNPDHTPLPVVPPPPEPPPAPLAFQSFRWTPNGSFEGLQHLPGDSGSQPIAINSLGQVVGTSSLPPGPLKGVLWKAGSTVATALPTLTADGTCVPIGINDLGVIAGFCTSAAGRHAVIWQPRLTFGRP
jgi:uncharacterized membrane protein